MAYIHVTTYKHSHRRKFTATRQDCLKIFPAKLGAESRVVQQINTAAVCGRKLPVLLHCFFTHHTPYLSKITFSCVCSWIQYTQCWLPISHNKQSLSHLLHILGIEVTPINTQIFYMYSLHCLRCHFMPFYSTTDISKQDDWPLSGLVIVTWSTTEFHTSVSFEDKKSTI